MSARCSFRGHNNYIVVGTVCFSESMVATVAAVATAAVITVCHTFHKLMKVE